jgi:tetratricopeptide (TPR) repeat protein
VRSTRWTLAFALVLVTLAFGPHLGGQFVWDDAFLVRDNAALSRPEGLRAILTQDLWGQATGRPSQLYHPVATLSLWLQGMTTGLAIEWLRAVNVLLHLLCVLLWALWLRRQGVGGAILAGAATLVLLHPSVTEPVMWITGRHDTLGVLFVLTALLAWPGPHFRGHFALRSLAAGVALGGAFLAKESYLVGPALLALYDLYGARREPGRDEVAPGQATGPVVGIGARRVRAWVLALLPAFLALAWRQSLGIGLGSDQVRAGPWEHAVHYAGLVRHYAAQLLSFSNGATITPYTPLSGAEAALVWVGILSVSLALLGMALRRGGRWPLATLGWAWWLASWVPHLVSVPTLGLFGNRYAYLGLFGLLTAATALAAAAAPRLPSWSQRWGRWATLPVAVSLALVTAGNAAVWRDERSLFGRDLALDPDNGPAHVHMGTAVLPEGGCHQALPLFLRATALTPDYPRAWHKATSCLIALGRFSEALPYARRALELAPDDNRQHYNLGVVLARTGQTGEARSYLERGLARP